MHKFLYLLILTLLLYGLYNSAKSRHAESEKTASDCAVCQIKNDKRTLVESELLQIDTPEYIVRYITDVINHGSSGLGFPGGVMEGGYAAPEDAKKIACYVLELSGRRCPHDYPKDVAMFYTSICGGCHGDDGKGLGGTYPDLTRRKLLGIARREAFLKSQIEKMRHGLRHRHGDGAANAQ